MQKESRMRLRSIFSKIYVWFWLTTTLVVATVITVDVLTESIPKPPPVPNTIGIALSLYGQTALEYYLGGRQADLVRIRDQLKNTTGIDAFLVDPMNREIYGRELPQGVGELCLLARQSGKTEFSFARDRTLLALTMSAADGKHYGVVAEVPRKVFLPPPRIWLRLIYRLPIAFIISGIIYYWLARYLTAPVIRLQEATRRFAEGEFTQRIGERFNRRKDELSGLANDFDHMAGRIESLMAIQQQLLADVSHELRSPLARLNVALGIVRRQTAPETQKALNRIEKEVLQLNEMIEQVLTLSRLQSGIQGIQITPVDLERLVQGVVADAHFEAQARDRIVQLIETVECMVSGNKELLRRAIENVVRNAVHYTRENSSVEIRLRRTTNNGIPSAEISVRDHGPGVPEPELPHLFLPFYRVSNARERQTGGTGLGLAITERAVRFHNGTVTASNATDGGLIVVILLPLFSPLSTLKPIPLKDGLLRA
jgi:two-component system, OmpR family, sensor histidine kinase CpxA